jgi:DNA-binding FadR family transcriptional regulator
VDEIPRKSLSEIVAGKLAAQVLDGTYKSGYQLPAERDLIKQFGISRSTLREALKALEEINLIESRHGVGWFISDLDEHNLPLAHEIAESAEVQTVAEHPRISPDEIPNGPRRLPASMEKP